MNYTNGFDLDVVLPALKGRVGWQDGVKRTYDSFHALCTEQNLRDIQPNESITDVDFATYKDVLEDSIIQRCLSSVFNQPEYIEQALLHNRIPATTTDTITNTGLFSGLRFLVVPDFRIAVQVKTIVLLFDEDVTFDLHLFQEGTEAPVKTVSVTAVASKPTVVDLSDWVLSYAASGTSVFYVGYFQSDLGSAQAIREQVRCQRTTQFAAIPCQAAPQGLGFNQHEIAYGFDSIGLNAEVHAFRDYTGIIKRSPQLFDEAIGLSMVYYMIEQLLCSTRSNATERILKSVQRIELTHYLYGSVPAMGVAKTVGLNDLIGEKFRQIRQAFYPKPKIQTVSLC